MRMGNPICCTGVNRLRATSAASALSGDTYSVCTPSPLARFTCDSDSRLGRKPASVLPEPVGAISSVELRRATCSISLSWCSRGCQPRASNQPRNTGGSSVATGARARREAPGSAWRSKLERLVLPCIGLKGFGLLRLQRLC